MYKKSVLGNGLRVITVSQRNTRAVTVLVLVKTGSKYENKKTNGISHFLEHMFFKGTKSRPSPIAIAETLDKVGGIYNAFTGEEYTGYFAKVESSKFELALDWVSDIFLNSTLPEEEIKKERRVIVEEINMLKDHPVNYLQVLWQKLLYGDQPAGWSITGTKENVMKMARKRLFDYRKSQYTSLNTIICVAGRINSKEAVRSVKKSFAKISKSVSLRKPKVLENQNSPNFLLHHKETDQTHLCLGVRAYNMFHPTRYPTVLLARILGGMMSSRMFVELREKLGLCYYIRTSVDANPDTGFLATQAGVDNKNVEKAISAILKEYKKIFSKEISVTELKKAKDNIKGKMALTLESSDNLASFYGVQELLEEKTLTPEEVFKMIDKVSTKDILKLAKKIFVPEKLNLALIGPFEDKKKIQKLLKL